MKFNTDKPGFIWKTYFVFFAICVFQWSIDLISPHSDPYHFYKILVAFHKSLSVLYFIPLGTAVVNILSLIPLFLYVYQKKFLAPRVWQWLFLLRLAFDLSGHKYDIIFIKSEFHSSPQLAIEMAIASLLVMSISYYACFQYAFRQDRIFADTV